MKGLVILFVVVGVVCAGTPPPDQSFDDIDLDEYEDPDEIKTLFKCVTGQGPCTPLEAIVRDRASDIGVTHCGDCTEHERDAIVILINRIARYNKADLFTLLKLIDTSGNYAKGFLKYLNRVSEERGLPKLPQDIIDTYPDN